MAKCEMLGAAHGEQVARIVDAFDTVLGVSTTEFASLVKTEQDRLLDWRARIAVVGQVKAGKSTFLSALVRHPQFLPSEINPWTAVITNLHFGHPSDPKAGGVFHFFGEDDWGRIIEGDKDTRQLAEDLLPGFTSEVLESQVNEMRTRARERLGRFYNVILGREHRYDFINRDILERYVCAGSGDDEAIQTGVSPAGRYSDITERADIYFPPGQFAIPAIFTDTPGVNDPFLVRDEFTCRTLLQSDIFVVTLSAHQALTEVDIGLVKMLAAHKGKRIIIFINRIDELDAFETTAPQIKANVSERVAEAIPDRNFDVIIGSAYWAEIAVGDDKAQQAAAAKTDGLSAFIKDEHGSKAKGPVKMLEIASGLTAVEQAIDSAITNGVGRTLLDESSEALKMVCSAVRSVHETRADKLRESQKTRGDNTSLAEAISSSLSTRSEAARETATELEDLFTDAETALSEAVTASWDGFRRELNLVGLNFVDQETDGLLETITAGKDIGSLEIDTLELRHQLEVQIAKSYASACEKVDFILARTSGKASQTIRPLLGDTDLKLDTRNLPHPEVAPICLSTTQTLSLELTTERGWKFWKNSQLSPEEAAAALKKVILAEYNPSIEHLAVIAQDALVERTAEAMRRMKTLSTVTVESISDRAEQFEKDQAEYNDPDAGNLSAKQLRSKLKSEISEIDENIELLDTISAEFGTDTPENALQGSG